VVIISDVGVIKITITMKLTLKDNTEVETFNLFIHLFINFLKTIALFQVFLKKPKKG
jgi:hypothetical protein